MKTTAKIALGAWCCGQALREVFMKPFEIAVKEGHAKAVMSAYNYIGTTWASACNALLNTVLSGEWGYKGFCLTDYFIGNGFMNSDQMIRNGNDAALVAYPMASNFVADTTSATSLLAMRRACKNLMYTVINSRAYSEDAINPGLHKWQIAAIAIDVILGLAICALEVLTVRGYQKRKK